MSDGTNTSTNTHTGIRPGKVDSLFLISHFLNFHAGGKSLFFVHFDSV